MTSLRSFLTSPSPRRTALAASLLCLLSLTQLPLSAKLSGDLVLGSCVAGLTCTYAYARYFALRAAPSLLVQTWFLLFTTGLFASVALPLLAAHYAAASMPSGLWWGMPALCFLVIGRALHAEHHQPGLSSSSISAVGALLDALPLRYACDHTDAPVSYRVVSSSFFTLTLLSGRGRVEDLLPVLSSWTSVLPSWSAHVGACCPTGPRLTPSPVIVLPEATGWVSVNGVQIVGLDALPLLLAPLDFELGLLSHEERTFAAEHYL